MKKNSLPVPAKQSAPALTELSDGQLSFIPEIPYHVQKARGPVFDEVLGQGMMERTTLLIDDVVESTSTPLPIQTRVMLDYEEIDIETAGMRLNAFDREIIDAIVSLLPYNDFITPEMIFRVMMGKRTARHITDNQRELVRKSLMRCSHARIKISLTDMCEKDSPIGRKLKKQGIKAEYSEPVLSFKVMTVEKGGKTFDRYIIDSVPVLSRYAASLGKVSVFPIDLFDTRVNKTPKNIILQSFLLRAIDEMYRDSSIPTMIDLVDIYAAIDSTNALRQHKLRIREAAETIFEDWIGKKYIKNYTVRKVVRDIKGYDIELSPSNILEMRALQSGHEM